MASFRMVAGQVVFDEPAPEIFPKSRVLDKPPARRASLTDKYRPRVLDDVVGQAEAVKAMRSFLKAPYPVAFFLHGESGTGKTATAMALANELGCDVSQQEFGGLRTIPSGEQSVSAVRDEVARLHNIPFFGSGWKVLIVNEADFMHAQVEAVWLDVLENLPPRTVIVFTTNNAAKLSSRFKDRCYCLQFASKADGASAAIRSLVSRIWKGETGRDDCPDVDGAVQNGHVSFRRVVQGLARMIDTAEVSYAA